MSHDLWWSDDLILDVPKEVFLRHPPISPRTELILSQDPLDVLKSEEYVKSSFIENSELGTTRTCIFIDFNDPASAAATAQSLQQQLAMDETVRRDGSALPELFGLNS